MSAALTSRGEDVNPKRLFQEAWASSVEFDWWCLEKSASVRCFAFCFLMASTGTPGSGPEGNVASEGSRPQRRQLLVPARRENSRTPRRNTSGDDEQPDLQDVPMTSHDALRDLVAKELGKFLPTHITKCIHKQSQDLRSRIQALQKTNERKKKLEAEITTMRAGQLPPSVKKVSHSFETMLLNSPAVQEGLSWQISPGDTIRAAKEKCHLAHHLAQKQLDLQLVDLHRNNLKQYVKRSSFISRCSEHFQNREVPSKTSCFVLDIEDDDDDHTALTHELGMTELEFQGMVVSLYKKIVDNEAAKVLLDKASGDKKQEQKQKFLEQVANKSPQEFLNETIDERLKLLTSKKGKGKHEQTPSASAQLAVAAIQSQTGKISPDLAGAILTSHTLPPNPNPNPAAKSSSQNKGKGKGKNKSKARTASPSKGGKSKGKSKGKAATSSPAKGKGAGKGKGKSKSKNGSAPWGKGGGSQKGKGVGGKPSFSGWPVGRWARNQQ